MDPNMRRAQVTTDRLALPPAQPEALSTPAQRLELTEVGPVAPPVAAVAPPVVAANRPAVKTMPDANGKQVSLPAEKKSDGTWETHDEIIARNKLTAKDIDRRVFLDEQGNEKPREQTAEELKAAGVEPKIPDQAHSTDVNEAAKTAEPSAAPTAETKVEPPQPPPVAAAPAETAQTPVAAGKGLAGEVRRRLEAGEKLGGEAGGGQLHQMIYDLGQFIYQKGMAFADWSSRMAKELGEHAKSLGTYLRDVWERITNTVPAPDSLEGVRRMTPEQYFDTAQGWSKRGIGGKGLGPQRTAEAAARANPDRAAWQRALEESNAENARIRAEVNGDPEAFMARQKEISGAATKHQFFQEGLKELDKPTASLVNPPLSTIEAGAGIPIPRIITDTLKKSRDTIKILAKTKGVRAVMAYTKDVAGNAATVYGQRVGNNVRGELKRAMGRGAKPNPLDENALTFVREADGDPTQLRVMRGKLTASTAADPKWKSAALKAIDHAEANWDRINPIAQQYERATDAQVAAENAAGINTLSRKGYVMHAQDLQNDFGFFSDVAGEGSTGFKHARTHDTFADSIAAGVDPKSINGVALLTQRVARGQMLINNRAWIEGLKSTVDPDTGKPVITEPEVIPRGPGLPPDVRAPTDYVSEIAGGRPIAVLKSYAGIFRALTEPSKFSESLGWNATLKVATTGKHIALMLDTFHLGRIAFWESIIKPLSLTAPKLPLPSYKRGVLTLDYSRAELQRMAASGEINPAHLNAILAAQRDVNGLVKHGYNVAKISDMLHQEWLQKIPITGAFNKWLFNQFQRGAMAEVGSLEVGRYRRMHPSWTDEQVYREVAKDLNTRFGNLGRQGIFKSKTAQDTARLLALAPQWNEGLIRSEIGAVTGTIKGVASSVKERRLSFGILPRAVGAMLLGQFAANQIINYITRGKPTWENEEEGVGAKLSAWVPDVIGDGPGFFLHPAGLAAEVTHLLTQKYEKKGDFREALLSFLGGRYSTLARPLVTFLTRRDVFGKLIRPENIWQETAKSAIPTPIGASAAVPAVKQAITGEKEETFPGQYQKQLMASTGVKTDQVPSPSQRIKALASEFKKSHGITESGEFYESAYAPLRQSLRRGNTQEIRQNLSDLLKSDHTPQQIENAIKPWSGQERTPKPFTGSKKNEAQFISTLTSEQRAAYRKALIERMHEYQTFQRAISSP